MATEVDWNETEEIGLRLPNGTIIWPPDEYLGFPIGTQEQRREFVFQVGQNAAEMGFDPTLFVDNYYWVARKRIFVDVATSDTLYPISADLPDFNPEPEVPVNVCSPESEYDCTDCEC